jgi:predicted transcriptional regulator
MKWTRRNSQGILVRKHCEKKHHVKMEFGDHVLLCYVIFILQRRQASNLARKGKTTNKKRSSRLNKENSTMDIPLTEILFAGKVEANEQSHTNHDRQNYLYRKHASNRTRKYKIQSCNVVWYVGNNIVGGSGAPIFRNHELIY